MDNVDTKKKYIKIFVNIIIFIFVIILWGSIVYYGISYSKLYIDKALYNIEIRNVENHQILIEQNLAFNDEINKLNEEIDDLHIEISSLNADILLFSLEVHELKASIDIIDISISSSVQIQVEIGARILELDEKLKELKNSLNILLEAPNE